MEESSMVLNKNCLAQAGSWLAILEKQLLRQCLAAWKADRKASSANVLNPLESNFKPRQCSGEYLIWHPSGQFFPRYSGKISSWDVWLCHEPSERYIDKR